MTQPSGKYFIEGIFFHSIGVLISSNGFAAKKVDYYNVSDILKDPGYATGKIAMISQLEIVDEIKAKRVYLARDQAGNKVVLNLVGKISTLG
jgi:hypothetical protein